MRDLVLIGGGGHASDVLAAIEAMNAVEPRFRVIGYLSDDASAVQRLERRGVLRLGRPEDIAAHPDAGVVLAIGYPTVRAQVEGRLGLAERWSPTIVHPSAVVGPGCSIGDGAVVLAGSTLSPDVQIGAHAHVSQLCPIGHDVVVGTMSGVLPGAVISGDAHIGARAMIGAGATVLQGLTVGDDAVVGAGALVTKDVPAGVVAKGSPARW